MLLRRVIKHVSDQNWTAIGIDFAIVVIGVFVGLQVTSWNEDRIAESRAEIYYQRLIDDLQSELKSRQSRIQYYEQTKAHAKAALRAMQMPEMSLGTSFLVDSYQASQRWVYAPHRTTYDELIAAGIADAIPDVEIREQLANFYVGLEASNLTQQEHTPFRDELRRQMPDGVQSAIRELCNDQYTFVNGLLYLELPEKCDVSLDENLIADAVDALVAYDDMEKDLARHISILDSKLHSLRALDLPIQEMIEVLKRQ
jgi:hypothetical protein